MQAAPESNWGQERHPARQAFMPWLRKTAGNTNENAYPMQPEKDIRLFQTTNSNEYDNQRKHLFSELPSSVTYLPNTAFNKSSQSLSATKYGSHVRKIQNLLQEMEQDEEQRLAQIRRDSKLILNPNHDQKAAWQGTTEKQNLLIPTTNRSGSLARHKSSPGLNRVYTYELPSQDNGRLSLSQDDRPELEAPYEAVFKSSHGIGDPRTQSFELEVPNSIVTDSLAELDVSNDMPRSYGRARAHTDSQPSTSEDLITSFADLDVMVSNSRSFYNGHRSSQNGRHTSFSSDTSRSHRSSRSTLIELDANPLSLVAELPTESNQLSPVEPRKIPYSRYGDRKFRTLPGEAYPLIGREPDCRTEQGSQTTTRTRNQHSTPSASNNAPHFVQSNIDPRTGLSYTVT